MLEVRHLCKDFRQGWLGRHKLRAVDDISFILPPGKTVGLMGPSGSGKSTVARLLTRLIHPTSGQILYQDIDLHRLSAAQFQPYRRKLQLIFQQPALALDPRQKILDALLEPLWVHRLISSHRQGLQEVDRLLSMTGLPAEVLIKHPGQLSGGQAQRMIIARALSLRPEVLIADEPTAMLDLSVQAQILSLLLAIQQKTGVSILLISHDPAVIRACANQVLVMSHGRITAAGSPDKVLGSSAVNLFSLRDCLSKKANDQEASYDGTP